MTDEQLKVKSEDILQAKAKENGYKSLSRLLLDYNQNIIALITVEKFLIQAMCEMYSAGYQSAPQKVMIDWEGLDIDEVINEFIDTDKIPKPYLEGIRLMLESLKQKYST